MLSASDRGPWAQWNFEFATLEWDEKRGWEDKCKVVVKLASEIDLSSLLELITCGLIGSHRRLRRGYLDDFF